MEDLIAVVSHLKTCYGYVPDLVVGHSRGSIVAMRWFCTTEDGARATGFVNVAGRYRMNVRTAPLLVMISTLMSPDDRNVRSRLLIIDATNERIFVRSSWGPTVERKLRRTRAPHHDINSGTKAHPLQNLS